MNRPQRPTARRRHWHERRSLQTRTRNLGTNDIQNGHRRQFAFTLVETVCAAAGLALLATSAGSLLTLAGRNHASAAARIRALSDTETLFDVLRTAIGSAHRVVVASPPSLSSDSQRLVLERSPTPTVSAPGQIVFVVTNGQLLRSGGKSGNKPVVVATTVESIVFQYGLPGADGNPEFVDFKTIPPARIPEIVAVKVDATVRRGSERVREVAIFRLRPLLSVTRAQGMPYDTMGLGAGRNV